MTTEILTQSLHKCCHSNPSAVRGEKLAKITLIMHKKGAAK